MSDGTCLSGETAAANGYDYVELVSGLGRYQRLTKQQPLRIIYPILLEKAIEIHLVIFVEIG